MRIGLILYLAIWLFIGVYQTYRMVRVNFTRATVLDSTSKELPLGLACFITFTIGGMFWPILVGYWIFKKIRK